MVKRERETLHIIRIRRRTTQDVCYSRFRAKKKEKKKSPPKVYLLFDGGCSTAYRVEEYGGRETFVHVLTYTGPQFAKFAALRRTKRT